MELKGKVALITGGTSGIGKATAALFLREGASVVITGRSVKKGEKAVKELKQERDAIKFIQGDVAKDSDAARIVDETIRYARKIDILFNNAGVELLASTVETSAEELDKVIDIDLKGTFLVSKYAIPKLLENGGVVVNHSSGSGLWGSPGSSAYSAAKGGVILLTKSMAAELAPAVRVNCICPGWIKTPMHDRAEGQDEDFARLVIPKVVPLQRIGTAEEVAQAVLFLSSHRSSYITGIALPIDGGLSCCRSAVPHTVEYDQEV
ncbi:MAG: SDR family oxidoreductase [Syntrophomonadaceae bacterium]|nr:SDR family oxidoreductase [Syntrophomonadaceae bacterium]